MFSSEESTHTHCTLYYDGLFNSNLLSAMKGMLVVLENLIEQWLQKRGDFQEVLQLFQEKKFVSILTKFDDIVETLYYWNGAQTSTLLISELDNSLSYVEITHHLYLPLIFIIAVIFYFIFVRAIRKVMINFYSILLIMPFSLIESNTIMVHHLSKIRKGGSNLY